MRNNLKLLNAKRLFLWLSIAVNSFALLLLLTGLINRLNQGEFLNQDSVRLMGSLMVVCIVLTLIIGTTHVILLMVWQFRSNQNIATVRAEKKFPVFWLWAYIIIPFLHVLFPFIFVRRYFQIMRSKVNFDLKGILNISTLHLVFGLIYFLAICMLGLVMNNLEHKLFYLITIGIVVAASSRIVENLLYLYIIKLLKKIDLAVVHNQVHLNESEVIDH